MEPVKASVLTRAFFSLMQHPGGWSSQVFRETSLECQLLGVFVIDFLLSIAPFVECTMVYESHHWNHFSDSGAG